MATTHAPLQLLGIDELISDEDRDIAQAVRDFTADRIRPHLAEWFETATIPARELAAEMGKLGMLGMHLEGRLRRNQRDSLRPGLPGARGRGLGPAQPGLGARILGNVRHLAMGV